MEIMPIAVLNLNELGVVDHGQKKVKSFPKYPWLMLQCEC